MLAYLVIREGTKWSDVYRLVPGRTVTIGRAGTNQIVIKDERASRQHAEIFVTRGVWTVRDLDSRNGTFVNGLRISQRLLRNGDTITVGDCDLRFLCDAETPSEKALRLITMPGALADLARQQPALA